MTEIAWYLRAHITRVRRFLKDQHLLRVLRVRGSVRFKYGISWTSARGFALAVAHFRQIQGADLERGRDRVAKAIRQQKSPRY